MTITPEARARQKIDELLTAAGWAVQHRDQLNLGAARGVAVREFPLKTGYADYLLFVDRRAIGAVEAKAVGATLSGVEAQSEKYSVGLDAVPPAWYSPLPFLYESTGVETYFTNGLDPEPRSRHVFAFHEPETLAAWAREGLGDGRNPATTLRRRLLQMPPLITKNLWPPQIEAITNLEQSFAADRLRALIQMATGSGKTFTAVNFVYRLIKHAKARRVLFLVDREALGEQAANAFKDTRMDSIQSFADIFGIKELLDEAAPESATAVHIATVQGMVRRVLYPSEGQTPPTVDAYDCIVVDECHRGYLLDRELSDTELTFRSYEDYISKYRRVIEYFDAVKIGLTATPALHTTEIFGMPVYTYSYREAVIDGFLIDHEPPIQIKTRLSSDGITWQAGEQVKVYDPRQSAVKLYTTPDEIKLEVDAFNRKVMTEPFNQVICEYLAREIDPFSRQKTLIFCVKDTHADLVVNLLKKAFQKQYGGIDDDAVLKITGAADKPMELIRRFKNERSPTIAVTVDLLTTGIDVPEICNLVFLRRVNSRILFDQMLGRATRLCPEVEKETFRVFDAVRLYEALQGLTEMQPVVIDPKISFSQLMAELVAVDDESGQELIREQLIAKFQRKKHRLSEANARDFETAAGMTPEAFAQKLRQMLASEMAGWFVDNPLLGEIMDRINQSDQPVFISEHPDELYGVERGYGSAEKPEDYLREFTEFIKTNRNSIPALVTVLTRPRDLTRKQLRELALVLDAPGLARPTSPRPGAKWPIKRLRRTPLVLSAIWRPATHLCPMNSASIGR